RGRRLTRRGLRLALLGALVARLIELRRVLVHLLLGRRVGHVGDSRGGLLDLRLDYRLLAPLSGDALLVRARLLDGLSRHLLDDGSLVAGGTSHSLRAAFPLRRSAFAGRPLRTRSSTLAGPAAWAPLAHRAEPFAVSAASPAALAALAETLGAPAAAARLILVAEPRVGLLRRALVTRRHDLALVDPDLDADPSGRRLRLSEAVVDVGADGMQRHSALGVALGAAHLAAAEPAATHDLDALRSGADRGGERALHRAPEADPVLELLRDRLCDELRVELGPLDLVDVDVDGLARHPVDVLAQRVDLDAGLADHYPRPRRVDVDRDALRVLADQDVGQARVRELLVDVLADADVLLEEVRAVLAARVPVRLPVVDDADAHPTRVDLLTH